MEQRVVVVSYDEVLGYCRKLTVEILRQPRPYHAIVAINPSGMVPACLLAQLLGIRRLAVMGIVPPPSRPQPWMPSPERTVLYHPNFFAYVEQNVLLVDAVIETGRTLARAWQTVQPYRTMAEFALCVLYARTTVPLPHFYATVLEPDLRVELPWVVDSLDDATPVRSF